MRNRFFSGLTGKPISVVIFVLFMISACSKDEVDDGNYRVKFKANGTPVEFNSQPTLTASFGQSGNQHVAVFTGYDVESNISIQVHDGKAIEAKNYSGYVSTGSGFSGALIAYKDKAGTVYTQGVPGNASITVSEITATEVRGTFSGTLKATGKADVVITDGEFFVKRLN